MQNKIQPWQEKILVDIESSGIKPGEMLVVMSGRNVGKSYIQKWYSEMKIHNEPAFRIKTTGIVDGETWYTVRTTDDVGKWIRKQDKKMWYEHIDQNWFVYASTFDINEKLFILMGVKFK